MQRNLVERLDNSVVERENATRAPTTAPKGGHFAQRDVKVLIAEGFTEFFYSNSFTCKTYMLPSGKIVKLSRSVDCSPATTMKTALRFGRALGLV